MEIAFSANDLRKLGQANYIALATEVRGTLPDADDEDVPLAKWRALPSARLCDVVRWIVMFAPDVRRGIDAAERIALFAARRAIVHFGGAIGLPSHLDEADRVQKTALGSSDRWIFVGWEHGPGAHLSRAIADVIVVEPNQDQNARDMASAMYVICSGSSKKDTDAVNREIDRILSE